MKKTVLKRLVCMVMTLCMLVGMLSAGAMAADVPLAKNITATKVSNPQAGPGEIDGLEVGGDRGNSYAWAMEQLGDYIYIGSNRYILNSVLSSLQSEAKIEGLDDLVNLFTNGEIPTVENPMDLLQACIVRYNMKTGEMETWFDSADYADYGEEYPFQHELSLISGFRASIAFKDAIYMNGMAVDLGFNEETGETSMTSVSMILRITNDNPVPEVVIDKPGGNMRAMCLSEDEDTLYIGTNQDTTDMNVEVLMSTDGVNFQPISEPETDFLPYRGDVYYAGSTGDVWDMVEYQGKLYLSLCTKKGAVLFTGYENPNHSKANKYGWVWEEIVGENGENGENGKYGYGLGNAMNAGLTPWVFNDDMYIITFSNPIGAEVEAIVGILGALSGNMGAFFESLKTMEAYMENGTSVFRLTSDGRMQMVVGDENKCPENIEYVAEVKSGFTDNELSTTQYNWRAMEHDGQLYIGTFDAYSIYKYITKLTNGDLFEMTQEEFQSQLGYLFIFLEKMSASAQPVSLMTEGGEAPADEGSPAEEVFTEALLDQAEEMLAEEVSQETIADAADYFSLMMSTLSGRAFLAEGEGEDASEPQVDLDELALHLSYILDAIFDEATADNVSALMHSALESQDELKALSALLDLMIQLAEGEEDVVKVLTELKEQVDGILGTIQAMDQAGIRRYLRISDALKDHDTPGFELFRTKDGIHYEAVTLDGFGDEYNYGVRNLLSTDEGLFVGTANPFYGAQLWQVTEEKPEPVPARLTVLASASAGGKITPAGANVVDRFDDITFTMTPYDGYTLKDVLVDGKSVGAVSEYTFERVKAGHTIQAVFGPTEFEKAFTDISAQDWFYEDVAFVYENGLMNGVGNSRFDPDGTTNRAMIVTVLWRLAGAPDMPNAKTFSDVVTTSWYTDAVNWAAANNIVKGYGDGTFGPNNPITREQVAAIFERYAEFAGLSTDGAASVAEYTFSSWAKDNVIWAESIGLYDGIGVDVSDLTKAASRAEIASYLHVFYPMVTE